MRHIIIALAAVLLASSCGNDASIKVGAELTDNYLPALSGKKVALFSNHTGMVGDKHTLDILLEAGVDVVNVFSPEHGFRGDADAGETVGSSVDPQTGVKVVSLYGSGFDYADAANFADIDVIISDIQDVGLRFYTYYVTMISLMESAARFDKEFIVLDRPNPNGMYVDGPVLDMGYKSGVGRLPIPVVHGMTLGEIALMANGEGWLDDGLYLNSLEVIACEGYTHQSRYILPVAPSPNLKSQHAIYLYPSMCYFEGTSFSLGRGTDSPFEIYGHPDYQADGDAFIFTPRSLPGAKNPPLLDQECKGRDLRGIPDEQIISEGVNLSYVIDAYNNCPDKDSFFTSFFELLIGRGDIRTMIREGKSAEEIKETWKDDVENFKSLRRKYLLYEE